MSVTYESRDVTLTLNEVMRLDFEECLDLLEELFFAEDDEEHRGYLSDIAYETIGTTDDGQIIVRVSGEVEREDDDEEDTEDPFFRVLPPSSLPPTQEG